MIRTSSWRPGALQAQAAIGHQGFRVEPRGGLEEADSRIFHYALTEEAPDGEALALHEAVLAEAPAT